MEETEKSYENQSQGRKETERDGRGARRQDDGGGGVRREGREGVLLLPWTPAGAGNRTVTDSAPCHSPDGWGSSCLWAPLVRSCPAGLAPSTLPSEPAEGCPRGKAWPQSLPS